MARIKFSPIISEVKGKLGNIVFQGGKSGIIMRERALPRNLNTNAQIVSRTNLAKVKSAWQVLSTTDLNSWISFATFFSKKTKFNQQKALSPYELFMQHNSVRIQSNLEILENTSLYTSSLDQVLTGITLVPNVSLSVECEGVPANSNEYMFVYISRPFKPSASISKSEVRFMLAGSNAINPTNITTQYINAFSRLPNVGEKVLIKTVKIATQSGYISRFDFSEIVIS